jgi:hypothetical protein
LCLFGCFPGYWVCRATIVSYVCSIHIQHALNDCVGAAARLGTFRSPRQMRYFWDSSAIRLSPPLLPDLQWVTQLLCLQSPECPHWSRSIGLLAPREIMFTVLVDACPSGKDYWAKKRKNALESALLMFDPAKKFQVMWLGTYCAWKLQRKLWQNVSLKPLTSED